MGNTSKMTSSTTCKYCVRYAFLVANGLFWALSVGLICYTTSVYITDKEAFDSFNITRAIVYLSYVCGVGVFVTGLIGCCTGVRLNKKCITGYLVLSVIFTVVGLLVIILAAVWSTFSCCGYEDPISESSSPSLTLDISCYNVTDTGGGSLLYEPYTVGCKDYLSESLGANTIVILSLVGCILASEVLGITTGIVILRRIKKAPTKSDPTSQNGFESPQKHMYRHVSGPVDIDESVFKEKDT